MRRLILTFIAFFTLTSPADAEWVWPVSGEVITPYRNGTDPYATGQHRGIDIAAPVGTSLVAAAGGEVRFAGTAGSSGLTISIRTADGYDTSYLHLSSISTRAGTHVSAGDRIGSVGTTGTRSAAAPHLHFGVRDAGTRHDYHDPLAFLPPPPPPTRTTEPPPPAPATAPEPAPPAAAPVTVPHTVPRSRPHATPHGRPSPQPHVSPRPIPQVVDVPRAASAPSPAGAPGPRLTAHSGRTPRAAARPAPAPGRMLSTPDPAPKLSPGGGAEHARPTAPTWASRRNPSSGPDIAWIAACAALLLTAGLLGVTGDRGTGTSRRIRALLRPIAARR